MAGTGRWIVLTRYTNEQFESKYRATAISVLSMVVGILFVLITFISGPIIEFAGGVRTMYTLLGLLTAITVVPLALKINRPGTPPALSS
jgi:MFS family permease